jgi:DNA-binding MarR family transcriptional regulator
VTADADRLSPTLRQHRQLARQVQRLDDELGLHHGLSWSDLLLLDALHEAGGRMPARQAAAAMGRSPAGLLRQVLPLEKIGLVQRARDGSGSAQLILAAGGARRLREARDTAQAVLSEDADRGGQPCSVGAPWPASGAFAAQPTARSS